MMIERLLGRTPEQEAFLKAALGPAAGCGLAPYMGSGTVFATRARSSRQGFLRFTRILEVYWTVPASMASSALTALRVGEDDFPSPSTDQRDACISPMPIMVRTETFKGKSRRGPSMGASHTDMSRLSCMNLVAGRSLLWPEIGT